MRPLGAAAVALLAAAAAGAAVAPGAAAGPGSAWGLADVGLVQLQLQVHTSSQQSSAQVPDHVDLCYVQDNRCFDERLEVRQPAGEEILPEGFAEIAVTRAGEDVRWLDALPEVPAVLYDRSGSPTLLPRARSNLRIVPQANTGREDDEMLRHILDRYDALPNMTVFLQGWPLLHCADIVGTVRRTLRSFREPGGVARLGNGAVEGLVPLSRTFYEYSEPEGLIGYARAMAEAHETGDDVMERSVSLYAKTCRSILGRPCPERHWVAEGAQWAVSRERIRSQPLSVYRHALDLGEGYQGKLRGLVLEAIWPLLWGADAWAPLATAPTDAPVAAEARASGGAGPLALLDLGTARAGTPDEEWCRRWSWTWLCESAGLPAGEHRRRRRGAATLYGSYSKSSLRSANGHCAAPSGNDALIWSCEDRMAFCDLQRHSPKPPQEAHSRQMLLQRSRFHTHAGEEQLEMLVRICALLLPGERNCVHAESVAANVSLRDQGVDGLGGTQWFLAGMAKAASGEVVDALGRRSFSLSTTTPRDSTRYLACDADGDEARLSHSRAPWRLLPAPDGLLRLRARDGRYLQLGAGPPHRLLCAQGDHSDLSIFSLQLEAHAPPDAAM